jgi:ABC-2 type transport system permease protein
MATQQILQPREMSGSVPGFAVLFRRESRKWWHTRRWWMQALLWLAILGGFTVFSLFVLPGLMEQAAAAGNTSDMPTVEELRQEVPATLFSMMSFLLPIAVILLVQNQVYGEKTSGVAAWVLSKPVSRSAYLLAKFAADALGIFLVIMLVPLLPIYFLLSSVIEVSAGAFLLAGALLLLLLLFYQAFTLMMSVLGNSSEIILGVVLAFLVGGMLLMDPLVMTLGQIAYVLPWGLPDAMVLAAIGQPLPPFLQASILTTGVLTLLCLGIALHQFSRQEL